MWWQMTDLKKNTPARFFLNFFYVHLSGFRTDLQEKKEIPKTRKISGGNPLVVTCQELLKFLNNLIILMASNLFLFTYFMYQIPIFYPQ